MAHLYVLKEYVSASPFGAHFRAFQERIQERCILLRGAIRGNIGVDISQNRGHENEIMAQKSLGKKSAKKRGFSSIKKKACQINAQLSEVRGTGAARAG